MTDRFDPLTEDPFDRTLAANVRPADWQNPRPSERYNLVVIGAGTAGLVTAMGAAGLGAKVALIERGRLGGDCLNVGCVPSKAILRCARAVAAVRDASQFGVRLAADAQVDFPAVMERMRRLRSQISLNDSVRRFQQAGVDVYLGDASFGGRGTIEVRGAAGERRLAYKKAVIATGARPAVPPIPGLQEAGFLTNETVFSLPQLPRRLAVLGGGPIGCELAQAFARFGSQVVQFEQMDRLLLNDDEEAAAMLERALARDKVQVLTKSRVVETRRSQTGKVIVYEQQGLRREIEVDEILVAVGRAPNVEGLKLDVVDVRFDSKKGVHVDDHLRTTNADVYACGDICLPQKFTHVADASARIVIQNALFFGRARLSALTIPWCTYTEPEIAHVGFGADHPGDRRMATDTYRQNLADVDRAVLGGQDEGFVKVHVRAGGDAIVGATVVAAHAGEMISELTLAITAGIGLRQIAKTIHPYPTQADAIRKLGDQYNRTRLTPRIGRLFQRFLAWRR